MDNARQLLAEIVGIHKGFHGNEVLKGIDLQLNPGEVLALIGGNGAGKSTLMKILCGLYRADKGVIKVKNQPVHFANTADAHKCGIYLVPQEPLIFPNMSVDENIAMGLSIKRDVLSIRTKSIMKELSWDLQLDQIGNRLSIAQKQLVEILRGLVREAEILILDEPTSALTFGEIDSLFHIISELTKKGVGIFYITHRLNEVFKIANTVAVLRDGIISKKGFVADFTYDSLVEGLIPTVNTTTEVQTNRFIPQASRGTLHPMSSNPLLTVKNLSSDKFHDISFSVFPGEIVGITGVVGAGRTELAETIFGIRLAQSGEIFFEGSSISKLSTRKRMQKGLAYVPEDRHLHGIFDIASIKINTSSVVLSRLAKGFVPHGQEKAVSRRQIVNLKIKCVDEEQSVGSLSGGNQQKVVLGKYLASQPKLLILDEPTRGIDANARNDIYKTIKDLKEGGVAVVVISSDIEEIIFLSNRVLVMHEGMFYKEFREKEITPDGITAAAFGVAGEMGS